MERKGGAYVAEGSIACSFSPPPPCQRAFSPPSTGPQRPHTRHIGKVFGLIQEMNQEWDITRPLLRADPEQELLLYPIQKCSTTRGTLAHADPQATARCTALSPMVYYPDLSTHERNKEPIGVLTIPYGGPDLYRSLAKKGRISLLECARIGHRMAMALQTLSRARLVHQDLKPDNIVLGTRTRPGARLIDFHLMVRRSDALDPERNPMLQANYWVHPPEYRMLSYLYESTPVQQAKDTRALVRTEQAIYQVLLDPNQKETLWDHITKVLPYEEYVPAFSAYLETLSYQARQHGLLGMHAYATRYVNRVDVYGLGLVLAYLLSYVQNGAFPLLSELRALVGKMLQPDPRRRPSPKALVDSLDALLPAH